MMITAQKMGSGRERIYIATKSVYTIEIKLVYSELDCYIIQGQQLRKQTTQQE